MVRQTLCGPILRRTEERFLHRVLADVEGTVPAQERAEDLRREFAQQVLDLATRTHISVPASCRTGQTSTALWEAKG